MKKKFFIAVLSIILAFCVGNLAFADIDLDLDDEEEEVYGEKVKSSWYIGFGLGTGNGEVEDEYGNSADLDELFGEDGIDYSPRIFINFGVGGIINPKFHFGFDITTIRQQAEDDYDNSYSIQLINYLGMVL